MELGIWELAKVSEFARSAGGRKWNREFRNPGFARSAGGRKWNRELFGILGLQGALGAGSGLEVDIGNFGILGLQGS